MPVTGAVASLPADFGAAGAELPPLSLPAKAEAEADEEGEEPETGGCHVPAAEPAAAAAASCVFDSMYIFSAAARSGLPAGASSMAFLAVKVPAEGSTADPTAAFRAAAAAVAWISVAFSAAFAMSAPEAFFNALVGIGRMEPS